MTPPWLTGVLRRSPGSLLLLAGVSSLPVFAHALGVGTQISCSIKNGAAEAPSELSFVVGREDAEVSGTLKRPDLLGRDKPGSLKVSVKPVGSFVEGMFVVPSANSQDEYSSIQFVGQYASSKRSLIYRLLGRLQLDTSSPKDSRVQLTVEEGRFVFMGVFEARGGSSGAWIPTVCEIKRP